jgi:hypothetical protein
VNRQSVRLVVAPDKFKGSLAAVKAAGVIEQSELGLGDRRFAETARAVSRRCLKSGDKPTPADSNQSY